MTKAGPFSERKPTFLLVTGRSEGNVAFQSGRIRARSLPHRMPPERFLAPPSSARSTRRTLTPFWARRMAAAQPAKPAPTTMTWNFPESEGMLTSARPRRRDSRPVYESAGGAGSLVMPFAGRVVVELVARLVWHHGERLDELDGLALARGAAHVGDHAELRHRPVLVELDLVGQVDGDRILADLDLVGVLGEQVVQD